MWLENVVLIAHMIRNRPLIVCLMCQIDDLIKWETDPRYDWQGHVTAVLTSDKLLIKLFNLKVHLSTVDVKNEKQRQKSLFKNLLIFFPIEL